jgi:hypothetical protein
MCARGGQHFALRQRATVRWTLAALTIGCLGATTASAEEPASGAPASVARATTAAALAPKVADPTPRRAAAFAADPISDAAIIVGAAGIAGILDGHRHVRAKGEACASPAVSLLADRAGSAPRSGRTAAFSG